MVYIHFYAVNIHFYTIYNTFLYNIFLLFIDYEKAYDNVNRDKLWEMMDNKIPNYLLNTIKCI